MQKSSNVYQYLQAINSLSTTEILKLLSETQEYNLQENCTSLIILNILKKKYSTEIITSPKIANSKILQEYVSTIFDKCAKYDSYQILDLVLNL